MTEPSPIPTSTPAPLLPDPGRLLRTLALICSIGVAVSVVPVLYVTLLAGPAKLWFSTLFELIVLAAAGVGVLAGLGRYRNAWGLSLACVAGTLVVGAVFASVEIRANFRDDPTIGRLILPGAGFRLAMAGAIASLGSIAVWNRDRASWRLVFRAFLVMLPVFLFAAWYASGRAGVLQAPMSSPGAEAIRTTLLVIAGLVGVGLVSVGGHLLIRSYETGRIADRSRK